MNERLQALLDKQEIYELICLYMRGLDRLDETLLASTFSEDAWCDYGFTKTPAADFASFCMDALRDHEANQHMIGNVLIDLAGDEAFGEVYFQAYHKMKTDSGFNDVTIAGRYLDRYERCDGVWKFAYRSEVVDWSRTEPTQDPYFDLVPDGHRGGREFDLLYRRDNRYKPCD